MSETPEPGHGTSSKHTDAHEVALELMKQLITLSSGVLALSATFIREFRIEQCGHKILLVLAWLSLSLSVFFGIQTISAIVKSRLNGDANWSTGEGKRNASGSKYCFLLGLVLFAAFALLSLGSPGTSP